MNTSKQLTQPQNHGKRNYLLWVERALATLALANLGLVLFDLSYVPFRNFYWREFPLLVNGFAYLPKSTFAISHTPKIVTLYEWTVEMMPQPLLDLPLLPPLLDRGYDYIKGINAHPETIKYLQTVDQLEEQLLETGLLSPETDEILASLQAQSSIIIRTNPFELAGKTGTLETIKSRMREHVGTASAEAAFDTFWTARYLKSQDYEKQIAFFKSDIAPLIRTNFLRAIDPDTGGFIDRFALLDIPFAIFFAFEFFIRTYFIHRRHTGLRWIDGMLWRWYDVFLFIPILRWLRVIPVTIRCNQSGLLDLEAVQRQTSQGFVAGIAEDITEVVVVQTIDQLQGGLKRGDLARILTRGSDRAYVDLNETNEVGELARLFGELAVHRILPKVRPDIEALIRYNVEKTFYQSPAYERLRTIPAFNRLEHQISENLVRQLYQVAYGLLVAAIEEDPAADELIEKLGASVTEAVSSEMQTQQTLDRIQTLLNDLLEEIKVNYVEQLSTQSVEDLLEQTRKLRQAARTSKQAGRVADSS
ncbi:hypothetical protein KR51_00002630 [Rubidibacter lacunae KORDI 51-2]|uniref:Uncharacterized protein n=1 Tax=Rubidibacter lacunae KORDI 51-2 TaxID=582515 RepID=U5DQ23_9CHRO|nr:hypothetical protein [Rubidibacter lacunae]ERN42957.1 hypothetical protein KR51_00002630 [Rubidibacter lacunae KORDI 51-2]